MSKKPLVVVTRPIEQSGITILEKNNAVVVANDSTKSEAQLKQLVKGADAIVSLLTEHISDAVLEAAGDQLKIVANYAVGFDNIDIAAAKKRGIYVTNTPGILSAPAVAEHVFALLFSVARHVLPADEFMRSGRYTEWDPNLFLGPQIQGSTVGIVGTGQIGSQFARMCHNGLNMRVLYTDVVRNDALEKDLGAHKVTLDKLLQEADVVSLHVPLLPSTHHLIGQEQLERMKSTAILINTARGPIIDEKALYQALKENKIFGAGLDVYENEPKLTRGLKGLENVVLTPHIGSATTTTRIAMSQSVARSVTVALMGKIPETNINR